MAKSVRIGGASLYHGDCFEILPDLSGIDALITDPPYGCTYNKWDATFDLGLFWRTVLETIKLNAACCICSQMPFSIDLAQSNRKMFRYDLIYQKSSPTGFANVSRMPLRCHEQVLVFYRSLPTYNPQKTQGLPYIREKGRSSTNYRIEKKVGTSNLDGLRYPTSVLKINRESGATHPTQKPVALMEWLIKTYTNPGDLVLDPFMGSGTTGVAALKNGRRFIGIEREEKYFTIACQRVEKATYEVSMIFPQEAVVAKCGTLI